MKNNEENMLKLNKYFEYKDTISVDIVDLVKTMAVNNGVNVKKTKGVDILEKILPNKKHTVFILLDGFGYFKLSKLDKDSILKQNVKMRIKTVNPTSTACVLTSIVSASYPNEHGIYGWWNYNRDYKLGYYPLLFKERKTGETLKSKGIESEDIFEFLSIFNKMKSKVNIFENREIINSEFTKMFSGKNYRYGYYSIKDAFLKLKNKLKKEEEKSFTYLYIDGLDVASHMYGADSTQVNDIINAVEKGIQSLLETNEDISIILTADHGQIDMASMLYLNKNIDFNKYFYALPTMDTRMISFFVKDEFKKEFEINFINEFGEDVILLTKQEAKDYKLFGVDEFTKRGDKALGEYIAIIVNSKFMVCDKVTLEDAINTKGNHSGLTKEEITVPLVIF